MSFFAENVIIFINCYKNWHRNITLGNRNYLILYFDTGCTTCAIAAIMELGHTFFWQNILIRKCDKGKNFMYNCLTG